MKELNRIQKELKAPKGIYKVLIICGTCGVDMYVRKDYVKKHSGFCMSCNSLNNSNALKHGDSKKRIYGIWAGMFQRRYKNNVNVCDEWANFIVFKKWAVKNGYKDDLTIDRIDNKLGYSPENCQFITHEENAGKDKIIFTDKQKEDVFTLRKRMGLTQRNMAKFLNVSRNTIQRAEKHTKEKRNGRKN